MKKEELRKVEFYTYGVTDFKKTTFNGRFHEWGYTIDEIIHEDKGSKYLKYTIGIVEDELTGKVYMINPKDIKFLTK